MESKGSDNYVIEVQLNDNKVEVDDFQAQVDDYVKRRIEGYKKEAKQAKEELEFEKSERDKDEELINSLYNNTIHYKNRAELAEDKLKQSQQVHGKGVGIITQALAKLSKM